MNKPSNDFGKVNGAQKAALEGVQTYAEKVKQDRELALLQHDLAWEAEKRRFEPKPEHQFHYGIAPPKLSPMEYRRLRAEHLVRRQEIADRFKERERDIQRVKENLLDRFNERTKSRDTDAARDREPIRARSHRDRDRGR